MNRIRQSQQRVDGVLLLDKPLGITSNDALIRARRALNARKAGHGGTLDPLASGLLPLAFGEATKFINDSLDADKVYLAEIALGVTTSTGDAEGEVLETRPVEVDEARIREALAAFTGHIEQVPPMHSALKHEGRPLYEYARAGQTIERAAREVTIHSIDLLSFGATAATGAAAAVAAIDAASPGAIRAQVRVSCSKGTYIRTLAQDIGRLLGCGAYLSGLRRERVGSLVLAGAVSLEQLEAMAPDERASRLQPADFMLAGLPAIDLEADLAIRFLHGQRLRLSPAAAGAPAGVTRVRVYRRGDLLGTGQLLDGLLVPQRLIGTDNPQAGTTAAITYIESVSP